MARGGAESVQLVTARLTSPRIEWAGVAVLADERSADPGMVAETRATMPVTFGMRAAAELAARVDVLVSWAAVPHQDILARVDLPPRVAFLDHFPHDSTYPQAMLDCLEGVDHLVGVSPLCEPGFPASFGGRTSVIWPTVDAERLVVRRDRAAMRRAWGVPDDAPVAGFFQRLSAEKDPLAAVRLAEALPDPWRVVVVGSGPLAGSIRAANSPRLLLLDADPGSGDVLNALDVLVVPSHFESFGLSLVEGLLAGLPVVSTRSGLAKVVEGLTQPIPINATGADLAEAVLTAHRVGPMPGSRDFARSQVSPARYRRQWSRLIEALAGPADPNDPYHLADRADRCEYGAGPCGCGEAMRSCSHPTRGGPKRRWQCIECMTISPAKA